MKTLFGILAGALVAWGSRLLIKKSSWEGMAVEIITHFEGFFADVYDDPIGIPTIGYGHVMKPGDPTHVSESQARAWLKQELKDVYAPEAFTRLENKGYDLSKMSASQKAAVVSFAYNLGAGAIGTASWPQKWKAGDQSGAEASWKAHCNAAGGKLPGLVRRRFSEFLLFSEGKMDFHPPGWEAYYGKG